jgi:hypothetical protein
MHATLLAFCSLHWCSFDTNILTSYVFFFKSGDIIAGLCNPLIFFNVNIQVKQVIGF